MRRACLFSLLLIVGCGGDAATSKSSGAAGGGGGAAAGGGGSKAGSVHLAGAGATFPQPLFDKWFKTYSTEHEGARVEYQALGSGAGINQLTKETVDFAASDDAMTDRQIEGVARGVQMIPITAGAVVLAYNLPGVSSPLKLSRSTYAGIFLGKITKWNDAAIAKTNGGVTLPDVAISIVHRSDSSGTTATITRHLAAISEDWKKGPGVSKSVKWPVGSGAKGNEQVIAQIKQTAGSIGYVEYGYAKSAGVSTASLENKAGKFVEANAKTGAAGLSKIKLPENLRGFEPDPDGDDSYPVVTFSWLLAFRSYPDAGKAEAVKDVVKYCLTKGQAEADSLGYLPLPEDVSSRALKALEAVGAKTGG